MTIRNYGIHYGIKNHPKTGIWHFFLKKKAEKTRKGPYSPLF
jgi:hypothetical protein